jgi:hypothetical protein
MRFLHLRSWVSVIAITLAMICSNSRALPTSDQVVVEAEDVDLAKLHSGGEIALVSSGQRLAVWHAIDGDRRTIFQFSDSDPRPTLIVKLIDNQPFHRVSVVVGSETRKVEVYLLGVIPRDLSDLDKMKPVGSIEYLGIAREAAMDFAPQSARYVALRWTLSKTGAEPLNVAEVCVLTHAPGVPAALAATDPTIAVTAPPILLPASP